MNEDAIVHVTIDGEEWRILLDEGNLDDDAAEELANFRGDPDALARRWLPDIQRGLHNGEIILLEVQPLLFVIRELMRV